MSDGVRLQPLVRARVASLGEPGRRWAERLPALLVELCDRWSLRLGRPLPGGSASYLVAVRRRDGSDAVLKLSVPEIAGPDREAVLRAADGRGYVQVLESAPEHHALLLERLGPAVERSGLTVEDQLDAVARALLLAWRAPDRPSKPKAAELAADIDGWRDRVAGIGRATELALAYAQALGRDAGDPVVVHGDAHPGNLLRVREPRPGAESGWCFVDPDPFVADRAYDLGVAVRDFSGTLLADPAAAAARLWSWCERVAAPGGTDPRRVWAWGFLERVSTGLYVTSFGAARVGEPFLRSAVLLADHPPPA